MWKIVSCVILLYLFVFISSQDINADKKGDKGECGQNLTTPSGNFHLAITNLSKGECRWIIKPQLNTSNTTHQIHLFIHYLFLHENDNVTLFKNETDADDDANSIIEPIHAQNGSITIVTEESTLVIKLKGTDTNYIRKFEGFYQGQACAFPIPPGVQIIHSPVCTEVKASSLDCTYTYNKDPKLRKTPSFVFEQFNFTNSEVSVTHSTKDGPYKHNPPMDFFPDDKDNAMTINVKMHIPSKEYFRLKLHMVDSSCHLYKKLETQDITFPFKTPINILNNGSITTECRWVFEHSDPTKILGIQFGQLHFEYPLDIISINDGASELSPPLLQVTASTRNYTKKELIRSTGPYLWVAFKPTTYASVVTANVTVHAQGGHHTGSGTISMGPSEGNDTVFLLEVKQGEIVLLNFTESDFALPATLSIYDGFDQADLLATLHGNVWYPVFSKSSKMTIIATGFSKGKFTAEFTGTSSGCLHMSTFSDENYILSGNCNNTCIWVIPPQDRPGSMLLLNLQFISLKQNDEIEILQLDKDKTHMGKISANVNHVPQLVIPANVGALVQVTRVPCAKENEDIVLVGHSSYVPACGQNLILNPHAEFQINSPLYPDTYPVYANCQWKISTAKENLVHLAFSSLKLAPNHCVKIHSSDNKTIQYEGNQLQEDLFLLGDTVVEFDSTNCEKTKIAEPLVSSEGFVLNGTVADCGAILSGKPSNEFTVPVNKTLCIWKVSIPETENNADAAAAFANIISYKVSKKDELKNYELRVYDGNSVRDTAIVNDTSELEIWSRTSNLIFIYKSIDVTKPSAIITIKYNTIKCNSSQLCENKMCLHPDWRCNGVNDCGDFSDEKNCGAVPMPPEVTLVGYTSTAFWVTIFFMLALGAVMGVGVPFCYQKYKNGQYRRFGDISVIE